MPACATMSLLAQFRHNRDERPDAAAFLVAAGDRALPITWREFTHDVEAIAWIIRKYVPGATIALLGANSYEWITAHAACLFSGAVVLPIENNLPAAEIAERLSFTGARVLIHSDAQTARAKEVKRLLPKLFVGSFGSRATDRALSAARKALAAGEPGIFDLPERDEDEISMLVFTSGTTSKPRGVELTTHGVRLFSDYWHSVLRFETGQRTLMLLPLNHIFGICATYAMLAHGVTLGVCPEFRHIYEAVERFRVDFLFLVPALAELLADKIAQRGRTVEETGFSLRWMLVGGAPLPSRTYLKLRNLGIQTLVGYGLTETTALFAAAERDNPRPGSAGRCCNGFGGMETRVSPDGILQIRGPSVLKGYYKEPERTAAVLDKDGWFTTGDYGRIDDDGHVWITGRASRTIILSSGKKIAPEELEERLLSIPGFQEVVVSGDFDTRELQAEVYAAVPEETVREQISILNQKLAIHKRIRRILVRTEPFPRTASGKIKLEARPRQVVEMPDPAAWARAQSPEAENAESDLKSPKFPVLPPLPELPREVVAFARKYILPLAVVAVVVVLANITQMILCRTGVKLPVPVNMFAEGFEVVFAMLVLAMVLAVVFGLRRWTRKRRRDGENAEE